MVAHVECAAPAQVDVPARILVGSVEAPSQHRRKAAACRCGRLLVSQVDLGAVVAVLLDEVDEPDCVVGT
jgi:hypothetical protein